jgi:predicted SAM-dependent methyltransferase
MLLSFIRNLLLGAGNRGAQARPSAGGRPLRLHIGGKIAHPDWKILDAQAGPGVDFVGHCADLSAFDDNSVEEIYASHVIEHLSFKHELPLALSEFNRVLIPGGLARIGVPDLPALCALYLDPASTAADRYEVMRMIFGGQLNAADFHYAGFDEEFLAARLSTAGFVDIERVGSFGLFDDTSTHLFKGRPISLNVRARKAA